MRSPVSLMLYIKGRSMNFGVLFREVGASILSYVGWTPTRPATGYKMKEKLLFQDNVHQISTFSCTRLFNMGVVLVLLVGLSVPLPLIFRGIRRDGEDRSIWFFIVSLGSGRLSLMRKEDTALELIMLSCLRMSFLELVLRMLAGETTLAPPGSPLLCLMSSSSTMVTLPP
eukprot:s260_g15.t1